MAASGVGQFSINVKSNLKDFYGELNKSYKTMKELTDKKHALQIDSAQLDKLRDKSQRIAAEMKELRQQKTEIKLGMKGDGEISKIKKEISGVNTGIDNINKKKLAIKANPKSVADADGMLKKLDSSLRSLQAKKISLQTDLKNVDNTKDQLKEIDKNIASLNRQKLEVDAEIQPIRTANVEIHKIDQEIDRINSKKIDIKVSDSLKNIGNTMNSLGDSILSKFNPLTSKLNQMFGFGLITRGIDTVSGMITGSLDSALNRVDTLNNATNTFKNMKFDDASINKVFGKGGTLSSAIDGLPTTLNDATSNVQLLASTTKDLDLSRDIFKAVNDGVLSFGGNADNVNSIVTQLTKSFASGKIQGEVFNSMLDGKMGPVLVEISKRMGYTMEELQKGLSDGKISVKEFQDALIDVDINGSDSLSSLEDSVKDATKGLKTSIANMKTAVGRGVANIIESLDKVLNDAGFGGFSGVFGKIGSTIEEGLGLIGSSLEKNKDKISQFIETIIEKFNLAVQIIKKFDFGAFFSGLGKGLKGLKDDGAAVIKILKPLFDLISKGLGNKNTPEMLGKLIPRLLELGIALKVVGTATKGLGFVTGILGKLKIPKIPSFGNKGKDSGLPLKSIGVEDLKSLGLKMLTIAGISANIFLAAKALQEVQKVGDLKGLQPKLLAIAEAVVGMGVLAAAVGFLAEKKPDLLISGLAVIAGISANIYLAAKALQQVGKIDSDFKSIQKKIGQIALCITEIGVLALAVGALMSTGVGAGFLIAGLAAILGIAGTMWLTAKALASIGNMELDSGKIKSSIETIKTAISDIGMMAFDGDPFEKIAELINSFIQLGIVASVVGIGNQLVSLQEIELDSGIVKTKIATIKESLVEFSTFGFDGSVFEKLGELLNSFMSLGIVGNIVGIGNELLRIQDIELEDELVRKNVQTIKDCLSDISSFGFDGSVFDKLGEFINSFISDGIVGNILAIGQELEKIQKLKLDEEAVGKKVKTIKRLIETVSSGSLINAIKTFESGTVKAAALVPVLAIFAELKKIGDILVKIQSLGLTEESLQEQINVIKNAINSISSFATDDIVNNLTGMSLALDAILVKLTQKFPPEFNKLGEILADKLNKGFRKKLNLQAALSEKIRNLQTDGARTAGSKIAEAINSGLANNLNIGDTIRNSINSALQENYSTKIQVELETTETKKTKSTSSKSKKNKTTKASGGLIKVPLNHKAEIQDSPEKPLLDNGEYVIPPKIVSALGVPFLEKLRSGQISRTFSGLAQSVSHTTSSVVNNIYHNNNTQNMNVYTTGNENLILKANRRFRMA
ncbi:tape measure protein [Enterococcus avium]|uniref:tape measure protein n=1 Tax=Enterococcus avium TaxID=33945 RepID=UPI0032E3CBC8